MNLEDLGKSEFEDVELAFGEFDLDRDKMRRHIPQIALNVPPHYSGYPPIPATSLDLTAIYTY